MKKDFVIRPLEASDRDRIETYFDRLTGETKFFFNHNECNRQRFRDYFDGKIKNFTVFVAVDPESDLIAGMVFLSASHYLVPMLGIGLDDAYTGCGLGVRLIEFIHAYARQQGMGGILLNVHYANTRAQALYIKMGYVQLGHSLQGQMLFIKYFTAEEALQ